MPETDERKTMTTASATRPFVFLDRDGVINVDRKDYTKTRDEWVWMPGALEGLRLLTEAGFRIIVVTNQGCIARGLQTEEGLRRLHEWMLAEIERHGGRIERIYHCPHRTADDCDCHKPKPGLLLRAAGDFGFDPSQVFFVGDSWRDIEAARQVGARPILVTGIGSSGHSDPTLPPEHQVPSLLEAANLIITQTHCNDPL